MLDDNEKRLEYTHSIKGKIKAAKQFEAYEKVRNSGMCNMLDYGKVSHLSGLTRECISLIQHNYSYFKMLYLNSKKRGLVK